MDGGAEGDRTPDLRNAIATLSPLSYGPGRTRPLGEAFPSANGKFSRPLGFLGFFVFVGGGDAEILVAGSQIDFLVGARLFVFVDRELVRGKVLVLLDDLLRLHRFERQRLL